MHEIAERGVAAHWGYKQGSTKIDGRQYRWLRELLDILEHASGPEEFLEHTKLEMFQDQVFCFTPKGDLIALPRGATPVDFAYAVHSEVGDTCVGAKINGRIMPLRTELQNGDQVAIVNSKAQTPSPAWERFVVTGKARACIRRFIRTQQRAQKGGRGHRCRSTIVCVVLPLTRRRRRMMPRNPLRLVTLQLANNGHTELCSECHLSVCARPKESVNFENKAKSNAQKNTRALHVAKIPEAALCQASAPPPHRYISPVFGFSL